MRNILLLLILAVVANIKVFAVGGTLYERNDTVVSDTLLSAGSQPDVKSFFTARLDSLVAKFDTLAIDSTEAEEYTNPAFVRMFVRQMCKICEFCTNSVGGLHCLNKIKMC
ncbi:MAG: hypothetical protein IIV19_01405 [Bacteroidaceae bacterium]|nr:hypothetical protein [Bacteroidaceae bacterium]